MNLYFFKDMSADLLINVTKRPPLTLWVDIKNRICTKMHRHFFITMDINEKE